MNASAPGKVILFGEHAVVYGERAMAMAVDLRLRVNILRSDKFLLNGQPLVEKKGYIQELLFRLWNNWPLNIQILSDIPQASGMGSSAALTVALAHAIFSIKGLNVRELDIAKTAFDVEYTVQGGASPCDTSVVTHGQGILLDKKASKGLLWRIEKGEKEWYIHHLDIPAMNIVVGYTGISSNTGEQIMKVRNYISLKGMDIIKKIGGIVSEAIIAIEDCDLSSLGNLMKRNHFLLMSMGLSTPEIERLIRAVEGHCYGAKLTGAGGGGSIIVLTDEVEEVSERIRNAGGVPYNVKSTSVGVRRE